MPPEVDVRAHGWWSGLVWTACAAGPLGDDCPVYEHVEWEPGLPADRNGLPGFVQDDLDQWQDLFRLNETEIAWLDGSLSTLSWSVRPGVFREVRRAAATRRDRCPPGDPRDEDAPPDRRAVRDFEVDGFLTVDVDRTTVAAFFVLAPTRLVLDDDPARPVLRGRLDNVRAAELLATLDHPSTAQAVSVGVPADGSPPVFWVHEDGAPPIEGERLNPR